MFEQKYEKYQNFLSENFHFLVVKLSVYLNRHIFVMVSKESKYPDETSHKHEMDPNKWFCACSKTPFCL